MHDKFSTNLNNFNFVKIFISDIIDANIHDNLCEEVKKVIEKHSQKLIWISSELVNQ